MRPPPPFGPERLADAALGLTPLRHLPSVALLRADTVRERCIVDLHGVERGAVT